VTGSAAIEALLARPPTTLSALEAAIGKLGRDVSSEDTYVLRRDRPFDGVKFLYIAFIGRDLHVDPDPAIAELRLLTDDTDLHALATTLRGAGTPRSERQSQLVEWRDARGEWQVYDHAHADAFWKLRDPPFATDRVPHEQAELIARIVELASRPFGVDAMEQAFGPIGIDGRWPEYFARGPTWRLAGRSVDDLDDVSLQLAVPLPCEPLVAALGWGEVYVSSGDVHMSSWQVTDVATKRHPVMHGSSIELVVETRQGLRARPEIPCYSGAYAIDGARVRTIRIAPAR